MAYDEKLAGRIRRAFHGRPGVTERRMFGGIAFMYRARMCCGIVGHELMVRVPDDEFDIALHEAHVRPMDFTGRPLRGFVFVSPPGFRTARALGAWVARGVRVAEGPRDHRSQRRAAEGAGPRRRSRDPPKRG